MRAPSTYTSLVFCKKSRYFSETSNKKGWKLISIANHAKVCFNIIMTIAQTGGGKILFFMEVFVPQRVNGNAVKPAITISNGKSDPTIKVATGN